MTIELLVILLQSDSVFCNDLVNDSVFCIDLINAYFMSLYDLHELVLMSF